MQYEMCYTNILQVLDLSQIPLKAVDRTMEDPFVIGGGPCSYNPEPIADFFDMFYIGEGETVYFDLMDAYKAFMCRCFMRRVTMRMEHWQIFIRSVKRHRRK